MSSPTYPTLAATSREAFIEQEFHLGRDRLAHHPSGDALASAQAFSVVEFWREAGPSLWFAKDKDFDRRFRERLLSTHEAAAQGQLDGWLATPYGALALVLLLDQFPRNAFRGTPRMYATDARARTVAAVAIEAGHDQAVPKDLRLFLYLPFGHSENLADQARSVALAEGLGEPDLSHAKRHCDIIRRFGRFPHRNPILGRRMTAQEQAYLDHGGYAG
ncbi:DUF924 family protein [Bradyrhizobium sp. LHD-71]|uniref:DUF924 family protein n=1 Tax=Bradyrhizobium sp. LHD-71 TaxID=3072141 RepID=UPI00280D85AE|nr:DUF924 family protein [Bradyrhizobium sp. LHD-71]MDQ8729602.1 DUF924 family protein [Bradyrhizobium sp. LHD-71]